MPLGVITRRNFPKFGDAVNPKDCVSKEIAILDHPLDEENDEEADQLRKPEIIIKARTEADYAQEEGATKNADVDALEAKTTIRVSNISRTVDEQILRDLFSQFSFSGRLSKFSLPRVQGDGTQNPGDRENKGYAYVAYDRTEDAQRAFAALDGKGFEHLILRLEWAKPDNRDNSGMGSSRQVYSGYGKALAQDTKDQVVFHSHGNSSRGM